MSQSGQRIREVWRKAAMQKTRLRLDYDEEGVTFDIHVQSSDIFANVFLRMTHGEMAERFGEWFASRPKEVQQGVLEQLQKHMESTSQ